MDKCSEEDTKILREYVEKALDINYWEDMDLHHKVSLWLSAGIFILSIMALSVFIIAIVIRLT